MADKKEGFFERMQREEREARLAAGIAELKRRFAAGEFPDRDPVIMARSLLGLITGVWRWYRPGGPLSLNDVIRTVSDATMRMLSAR